VDFLSWFIDPSEWWNIYYGVIVSSLKLSFHRDQEATEVLSRVLSRHPSVTRAENILERIRERDLAVVVGCSESVRYELNYVLEFNRQIGWTSVIVAADGAVKLLLERGVLPDLVVTDLDGDLRELIEISARNVPLVVHAHGDNIEKIESVVPLLRGPVVGSTQVEPRPLVYNFGGFTDGDRAVYILYHAGYRRILLVGFDFEKPFSCPGKVLVDSMVKLEKLKVAKTLLLILMKRGVELLKVSCSGGSCSQIFLS